MYIFLTKSSLWIITFPLPPSSDLVSLNVVLTEMNQEDSADIISIVLVGWLFFFFKGKQWDKAIICPANRDFYQSLQLIRSGWLAATGVTKIALCSVDIMRTELKWLPLQIQVHLCSTLIMTPIDWKWQKKTQLSVITRLQSNTHFEKSLQRYCVSWSLQQNVGNTMLNS